MKVILLVLFVMLLPVSLQAQTPAPGWLDKLNVTLIAGNVTLNSVDGYQTGFWVGARKSVEANPLYAPFVDHPTAAGLYKGAVGVASAWLLLKYRKDHPKIVAVTAGTINGLMIAVVAHNATLETKPR